MPAWFIASQAGGGIRYRADSCRTTSASRPAFGPEHDCVRDQGSRRRAPRAKRGSQLGARAYATGNNVCVPPGNPTCTQPRTRAAHVVQQRGGRTVEGAAIGAEGRRARDATPTRVADRAVSRRVCGGVAGAIIAAGRRRPAEVQRAPASPGATADNRSANRRLSNLPGFIDTSDGANLRTGPAETGGQDRHRCAAFHPRPGLFVRRYASEARPAWWYVTAFLPDKIRGAGTSSSSASARISRSRSRSSTR